MNIADLRRLNRFTSLTASVRAAELEPVTPAEHMAAVAGAIADYFPDAIIASSGPAHAPSLNVTVRDGDDLFVFFGRDGRLAFIPITQRR